MILDHVIFKCCTHMCGTSGAYVSSHFTHIDFLIEKCLNPPISSSVHDLSRDGLIGLAQAIVGACDISKETVTYMLLGL